MQIKHIKNYFISFILLVFCISGIYQSYELTDSFFVRSNNNHAAIYEKTLIDCTQNAYIENISSLSQFFSERKEQEISQLATSIFTQNNKDIFSQTLTGFPLSIFGVIIHENCLEHFCCSIIANYLHLKDGQKIA